MSSQRAPIPAALSVGRAVAAPVRATRESGREMTLVGRYGHPGGQDRLAVLALVAAGTLWGTSFLFGKLALRELGPAHLTLLRFAIASLVLLPVAFVQRVYPRRRDLPVFALAGVLNVPATFLVQFVGLRLTSASVAALIVGAVPPMIAVAARLFLGERLSRLGWAAVGVSSAGVALTVTQPGAGNNWAGDALVFASLLAVVGWVLLGRRLTQVYPSVSATAYILAFGTLATAPLALLMEGPPHLNMSGGAWAAVLALGLGCSAATTALWNWGLRSVPAGRASVYLNLEPLVGALLGVVVLGQGLSAITVLGGVLILGAAVAVSRQRTRE